MFLQVQIGQRSSFSKPMFRLEQFSIECLKSRRLYWLHLTSLCNWSIKLTPLSNQSDTKLHPITNWLPAISRALGSGGDGGRSPGEQAGGRGREAGSGIYMKAGSRSRNKERDSLLFIAGFYLVKNTYLAKF